MKAWGECWPLAGASNISEGRRPRAGAALQFQLARATPGARRRPVLPARRRSAPARDARHQSADGGSAAGRVHRPQARRLGRAECRQLRRRPVSHRYGQDARPQDHQHRSRPELVPELQVVGGDLVAVDQPGALDKIRARIGGSRVPLGIDGVAGKATATIAGVLSESGTLLVYALMSGEPVTRTSGATASRNVQRERVAQASASASRAQLSSRWIPMATIVTAWIGRIFS